MSIEEQRLTGAIRGVSPCSGCTERFHVCWDYCPKDERGEFGYKAWKAEIKRVKKTRDEYIRLNAKKYYYYGGDNE